MNSESDSLSELLHRLQWLLKVRHLRHFRHHGPMGAPQVGQGRVLALLKLKSELSQKEMALVLGLRPQSLGELLAKLERQGYITRSASTDDRRSAVVTLTEAGRAAADNAGDPDDLFSCLNAEEQGQLSDFLRRLVEALEAEVGDAAEGPWDRPGFGPHGFGPGRGPGWGHRHGHERDL